MIKPDSKVLSGLELESALNPLEDQSYYFSSVRSTSDNKHLAIDGRPAVIGTSPSSARLWIGPTRSWSDFISRLELILDHASTRITGKRSDNRLFKVLARPVYDLKDVEKPYEMALILPEQHFSDTTHAHNGERWIHELSDSVRFAVQGATKSPNFESDVFWGTERLGRLSYTFEQRSANDLRLKVDKLNWSKSLQHADELLAICRSPENLTIYFDTGHSFGRGQLYLTNFRDAPFREWRWVQMTKDGVEVKKEKPGQGSVFNVRKIGRRTDRSLFGLIVRHWPDLENRGRPTGWLVCDDGSMESADFIHLNVKTDPPQLTLIHVKGSSSDSTDRGISVTDYEIVVSQAVKNLRHVFEGHLLQKLKSNDDGQLKSAVWKDGKRQRDRHGVLKALEALHAKATRHVVVLQPRVRRSVYDTIRKDASAGGKGASTRRLQQLDALLLGARANCYGLGASFTVIGEDDAF